PEENADLLDTIKNISGHQFEETGVAHGMTTEFFEDLVDSFSHDGQSVCFSGKFVTGTRKVVEGTAQRLGAAVKRDVTNDVTALVIGTIASRDWRFSSHGRKIEKAIKLKEKGSPVVIITERTWLKYI
ncbi:BRCT domain-containing protein, partial [Pseudomonadota bacterium]